MDFPKRIQKHEIKKERHFDYGAVREMESISIKDWLRHEANAPLSVKSPDIVKVLARAPGLIAQIRSIFGVDVGTRNRALMTVAASGELAKHVPASGLIITYLILKWFAFLSEIAIGSALVFSGNANFLIIPITTFLACGGLLMGHGVAKLITKASKLPKHWDDVQPEGSLFITMFEIIFGILIVVGSAYLRTRGAADADGSAGSVLIFVVVLALTVAIFEALHKFNNDRYTHLQGRMYDCQLWRATDLHLEDCKLAEPAESGRPMQPAGAFVQAYDTYVKDGMEEWKRHNT